MRTERPGGSPPIEPSEGDPNQNITPGFDPVHKGRRRNPTRAARHSPNVYPEVAVQCPVPTDVIAQPNPVAEVNPIENAHALASQLKVWRASSMQEIANSVLAATANIMHAIVHNELTPGMNISKNQIHDYGANLNSSDLRSVQRTLILLGLATKHGDTRWQVTPQARHTILNRPDLNWAQDYHDAIQRVNDSALPRSLEEYTVLNILASIDTPDHLALFGANVQADIQALGVPFSDERKRKLMDWLVNEGFVERKNHHDAYIITPEGTERARTAMIEFTDTDTAIIDRVEGRAEAMQGSGAGRNAASRARQERRHEIAHHHYSDTLHKIHTSAHQHLPGDAFPVTTRAANARGMTYHELKNASITLVNWGILEKLGAGQFRIHANAAAIIAGSQAYTWYANNANRLKQTASAPNMPGIWAQQALLEIIANGDIASGRGMPSKTSIINTFQASGDAFGPKAAKNLSHWLHQVGVIVPEDDANIKRGYVVAPNGQTIAQSLLDNFKALDVSPLVEIPAIYKTPLHSTANTTIQFAPNLHNSQTRTAIFTHLLASIAQGTITQEQGIPSSKKAMAEQGLPAMVLTVAHSQTLVNHGIMPKREDGEKQHNAHRDYTPLLDHAQDKINASPYLRWLANNADAVSSIDDVLSPLNEAEYAVLEMVAGRDYLGPVGTPSDVLLSPRALQALGEARAEAPGARLAFRTDARAQYCHKAINKYKKLGLIRIDGPNKRNLSYTRTANAQGRAQAILNQFDAVRPQAQALADSLSYGELSDSSEQSIGQQAMSSLQQAIDQSLQENHATLLPNQLQMNNLTTGFYWHNPSPDGNCLFHALAKQFPELGTHLEIREQVAVAAESNPHMEATFRQDFVAAVRQPGEYTGVAETAIQVAAEAFDIHIQAVIEDGSWREFGSSNSQRNMTLARNHDHFFLMRPSPEATQVDMSGVFKDDISISSSASGQWVQPQRATTVDMRGVFSTGSSDSERSLLQFKRTAQQQDESISGPGSSDESVNTSVDKVSSGKAQKKRRIQ